MTDPSAVPGHTETTAKRIRVVFGGEMIVESIEARLVWENQNWGEYYFPIGDILASALVSSGHTSTHPLLGNAVYYTVRAGEREAVDAAWGYPSSPLADVRDLIRFDWKAMDHWYEESEEVFVDPRNPYARLDVLDSSRRVQVSIDGVKVADTTHAKFLFETRVQTRYYIPHEDIRMELLSPTDSGSRCPYKGVASYWSATVNHTVHQDIAWSYEAPLPEVAKIAGHMCFYNERVSITVTY